MELRKIDCQYDQPGEAFKFKIFQIFFPSYSSAVTNEYLHFQKICELVLWLIVKYV